MLSDTKIRNYLKNNQLHPKCRKLHPLKSAFKPPLGTSQKCLSDSREAFFVFRLSHILDFIHKSRDL